MISQIGKSIDVLATWTLFDRFSRLFKSGFKLHLINFPEIGGTLPIPDYVEPMRASVHKFAALDMVDFGINAYRLPRIFKAFKDKVQNDGFRKAIGEGIELYLTSLILVDDATTAWSGLGRLGYINLPEMVSRIGGYVAPVLLLPSGINTVVKTYRLFKEMKMNEEAVKPGLDLYALLAKNTTFYAQRLSGKNMTFLQNWKGNPKDKAQLKKFVEAVNLEAPGSRRDPETGEEDLKMKQLFELIEKVEKSKYDFGKSFYASEIERKTKQRQIVINSFSATANIALGVVLTVNMVNPLTATMINGFGMFKSVVGASRAFVDMFNIAMPAGVSDPQIDL